VPQWPAPLWIGLVAVGLIGLVPIAIRIALHLRGVPLSPRRKVAMALWREPREGYIHARLEVDVEEGLAYLAWLRGRCGRKVTVTHLVGKAVGEVLVRVPEFNRTLVWDTLLPHETADLSVLVGLDDGEDVDWVKIEGVEHKAVADIAAEVDQGAARLRAAARDGGRRRGTIERLTPVLLLRPAMALAGWFSAGLGLGLGPFGVQGRPFGNAVITTAATFGIDEVYDARTSFGHVPFNVVVCRIRERAVARDGRVEARRCFNLCINADHRCVDAGHLGRALDVLRDVLEQPWQLEGLDGPPPDHGGV
jgi:hypothetical protein